MRFLKASLNAFEIYRIYKYLSSSIFQKIANDCWFQVPRYCFILIIRKRLIKKRKEKKGLHTIFHRELLVEKKKTREREREKRDKKRNKT